MLGSLLVRGDLWPQVAPHFKPEMFTDPLHQSIATAVKGIGNEHGRVSVSLVSKAVRSSKAGQVAVTASVTDMAKLAGTSLVAAEAVQLCTYLRDLWRRRRVTETLQMALTRLGSDEDRGTNEILAEAQRVLLDAFRETQTTGPREWTEVVDSVVQRLEAKARGEGEPVWSTGLLQLDHGLKGLHRGWLHVFAARPSMGKSLLALTIVIWLVLRQRVGSLIFSLEQDAEEWAERAFWRMSHVTGDTWWTPDRWTDDTWQSVRKAAKMLRGLPIQICDQRGLTVDEICAIARSQKAENPELGVIVVDHLTLIRRARRPGARDDQLLSEISLALRELAKELQVAVVLLCQLNRGVEKRDDKRPRLSDVREAGELEEHADTLVLLYRDEYYYPDKVQERGSEGVMELIFGKLRQAGARGGRAFVKFEPGRGIIRDLTPDEIQRYNA